MRHPLALLIPAFWLAWIIYWFAASLSVKPVRRRESAASRATHVIPLLISAVLLGSPRVAGPLLDGRFMTRSAASFFTGVALVAAGLLFSVAARVYLGGNWSGTVTLKQDHTLTRTGPYRYVRHPIYTGILLAILGSALALAEWRGLVALALVVFAFLRKIRTEEQFMIEQFGEDYERYRREVPALVPGVM
ncbi:MAG TPA: isoprenylcysteine carboxylmethyltransferase family protein [Acetobacteraceae bacterium]|jgi:protein-S-isoprenylcysteine O-methyltransferase Ste14